MAARLKLSHRVALGYVLLESPFLVLLIFGCAELLSLKLEFVWRPALLFFLISRVLAAIDLVRTLAPVEQWRESGDVQTMAAAELALRRAPFRFIVVNAAMWTAAYVGLAVYLIWAHPLGAPLGKVELLILVLFVIANWGGSGSFVLPVINGLSLRERAELSRRFSDEGMASLPHEGSLGMRLTGLIVTFILTPTTLLAASTIASEAGFERYRVAAQIVQQIDEDLDGLAAGKAPRHGQIVPLDQLPAGHSSITKERLPETEVELLVNRRVGEVQGVSFLGEGRWLLVSASVELEAGQRTRLLLLVVLLCAWAVAVAVMIPKALIEPLQAVERAMGRLLKVGDIQAFELLPVVQDDELGSVVRGFNELAAMLRELADTATAVSEGRLDVQLSASGDLHDAFRGMLAHLREVVGQLHLTAEEVGQAASELLAAAQSQERAGIEHAGHVHQVSERISSLAAAAAHITTGATGVMDSAEQSHQTAETMDARIGELSTQARGISELLDRIRDIAGRSDLLALNGSLEATRAGEAGRGFALVAMEMRRLAERITETVSDVGEHLARIDAASATAESATRAGQELAKQMAAAAQDIFAITRRHDDDTAHVVSSVREMSSYVGSVTAAMTQTRATAESLGIQVADLEALARRFESGEPSRSSSAQTEQT